MKDETLTPELCTVAEIFDSSGSIYTVPVYQRSYAWQAEQIEQLISDVQDAIENSEESYFLGNLIVTNRGTDVANYEVIDGQQRLTTLYLLLTFLRQDHHNVDHVHRLRYESRPRSSAALRSLDAGMAHIRPTSALGDQVDAGIHQGYSIIQQFMRQNITGEALPVFRSYLMNRVHLVRASLPQSTDLNRYFEVMNTRGQQLQPVDIVKARMMSILDTEPDRACFAWIWDACAEIDVYVQASLTRRNHDLRNELFDKDWSWPKVSSFSEILDVFAKNHSGPSHTNDVGDASSAPLSLDDALSRYLEPAQSEATDSSDAERFSSTIPFTSLLLHTLTLFSDADNAAQNEGSLDDKNLISLFNKRFSRGDQERVQSFIALLLNTRLAFDAFVLKREFLATHSDEGDWSMRKAKKVKNKNSSSLSFVNTFGKDNDDSDNSGRELLRLQSMLRVTYTSPRTMHWITLILDHALKSERLEDVREQDLIDILRSYARNRVRAVFPIGIEPTGFNIPRIVFTYIDFLLVTQNLDSRFDRDYLFSFRTSIEHFYPQHPDEQQSGGQVSAINLHSLGNLALVSVGTNSKFSNSLPHSKATNFRTSIEAQSPKLQIMAERTRELGLWDDTQVEAHHLEILQLLRADLSA